MQQQGASASGFVRKQRTMSIPLNSLIVQIESPVDFASLKKYKVDMEALVEAQKLSEYFKMLNGPTYENLVKDFWVRAEVYDGKDAKAEERQAVSGKVNQKGKTGKGKDLKPVSGLEIRSVVMGIRVTITKEVIAKACRVVPEGRFEKDVKKEDILLKSYTNLLLEGNSAAKTSDMEIHHRMLVKFCTDCFIQRGGGSDQPNHEQKLAIYFMATFDKINLPKYIMHHLCWAII
jgi:hypothetical protein